MKISVFEPMEDIRSKMEEDRRFKIEPHHDITCIRGFRPGPTKPGCIVTEGG